MLMGGFVAEEEIFSDVSTGASNDLKEASQLSRRLVMKYGMSALGPITFGKAEEMHFLGKEMMMERDYSEEVAAKIDGEVNKFLTFAHEIAKKIVKTRKKVLDSWDGFIIPAPFARGVFVYGQPIEVSSRTDETGMESARLSLERALADATQRAEEMACRIPGAARSQRRV